MKPELIQLVTEEEFSKIWFDIFGEAINPKDELFRIVYMQYNMALFGQKLLMSNESRHTGQNIVYNFSDAESALTYGEIKIKSEKHKFIRYTILSAITIICLAFILIFSGKSDTDKALETFYNTSTKEIVGATPYIKLKVLKTGGTYKLGTHLVKINVITYVIPLTKEKLQYRK